MLPPKGVVWLLSNICASQDSEAPQKIFGQKMIQGDTKQSQNLGRLPPIKLDHTRPFFSTKGHCMGWTHEISTFVSGL